MKTLPPHPGMTCSDAHEGLKGIPDKSIDLIVTDPAYDSMEKWRDMGTTTRLKVSKGSSNEWFPVVAQDYYPTFFEQCYRVLKSGTHLYVFCDSTTYAKIYPIVEGAGFTMRKALIFYKQTKPQKRSCLHCDSPLTCPKCGERHRTPNPATGMGYPYNGCYEMVLFACKGHRPTPDNKPFLRDVLPAPWIKHKGAYPTEKPEEILMDLIRASSQPGEIVLDPFAGSGSTLRAAQRLGRVAYGFDILQSTVDRYEAGLISDPPVLEVSFDTDPEPESTLADLFNF